MWTFILSLFVIAAFGELFSNRGSKQYNNGIEFGQIINGLHKDGRSLTV